MKTIIPFMRSSINPMTALPVIVLAIAWFALAQMAEAVSPAPDGGYAGNNTAEGTSALFSLTSGIDNTGLGFQALYHDTTGFYNTGTGFHALFTNTTGAYNTATGLNALLGNTGGRFNTADGANALVHNTTGFYNTGTGWQALFANTTGIQNTGTGVNALTANTTGNYNTATGVNALYRNTTGFGNVAIGDASMINNVDSELNTVVGHAAGANITMTGFGGNIYIGAGAGGSTDEVGFIRIGTPTIKGFPYDTFIAGIFGRGVAMATATLVYADANQKVGTVLVDANGNSVSFKPQAMLDDLLKQQKKIAELEATVDRQQKATEVLTAQLKDQAAQIQRVSAKLEIRAAAKKVALGEK
jgi:hypothetical protein